MKDIKEHSFSELQRGEVDKAPSGKFGATKETPVYPIGENGDLQTVTGKNLPEERGRIIQ